MTVILLVAVVGVLLLVLLNPLVLEANADGHNDDEDGSDPDHPVYDFFLCVLVWDFMAQALVIVAKSVYTLLVFITVVPTCFLASLANYALHAVAIAAAGANSALGVGLACGVAVARISAN